MSFRRRASNAISDDLYVNFKANFPRGSLRSQMHGNAPVTPAKTLPEDAAKLERLAAEEADFSAHCQPVTEKKRVEDDVQATTMASRGSQSEHENEDVSAIMEGYETDAAYDAGAHSQIDVWGQISTGQEHRESLYATFGGGVASEPFTSMPNVAQDIQNQQPHTYSSGYMTQQHFQDSPTFGASSFPQQNVQGQQLQLHQQSQQAMHPRAFHYSTPLGVSPGPVQQHFMSMQGGFSTHQPQHFHYHGLDAMTGPENLGQSHDFLPASERSSTFDHRRHSSSVAHSILDTTGGILQQHSYLPASSRASEAINAPPEGAAEFRFHTVLHTKTALGPVNDPPVTYLNKSQPYRISVRDLEFKHTQHRIVRYRTYVRITFDDPTLRAKPDGCWQMWKDGRGNRETSQSGGPIQSIEFIPPSQEQINARNTHVSFVRHLFDGFCFEWSLGSTGAAECEVYARFNFLSTDFSHSKGVKGTPLRLCSKTEIIEDSNGLPLKEEASSLAYCRVKLFRDHGAERKNNNDNASIEKNLTKLKDQQKNHLEGGSPIRKRRRSDSQYAASSSSGYRSSKVAKIDEDSAGTEVTRSAGIRLSHEEEISNRIANLEAQKSSSRNESVFWYPAEPEDDPELYPVLVQFSPEAEDNAGVRVTPVPDGRESLVPDVYSGQSTHMKKQEQLQTPATLQPQTSHTTETSVSSIHLHGSPLHQIPPDSKFPYPTPSNISRMSSDEWPAISKKQQSQIVSASALSSPTVTAANPQQLATPQEQGPVRLGRQKPPQASSEVSSALHDAVSSPARDVTNYIDNMDASSRYREPTPPQIYVARFLVRYESLDTLPVNKHCYYAIYLRRRTREEFIEAIVDKIGLKSSQLSEVYHFIDHSGTIMIHIDDDVVYYLPEGQAIIAQVRRVDTDATQPGSAVALERDPALPGGSTSDDQSIITAEPPQMGAPPSKETATYNLSLIWNSDMGTFRI